ncbi:hypothetical protein WI89_00835 [Burkholderia ubonensis]|uniref:hypothetical protein n=1 Tax=Burkholderia ubonensis TaxID=101571 RepID=UPI00075D467C|nr:hypothetical protein [Burkholderia ubonensis]KVD71799.1 hypothetical protein WI89_00835 [Burkholderia ubonensis]
MKWTTELPTQPGTYWIHEPQYDEPEVVVVTDSAARGLIVLTHGSEMDWPVSSYADARWYGPITPPSEDESASPALTDRQLNALAEFIFHELGSPSDWCGFDFDGARRAIAGST